MFIDLPRSGELGVRPAYRSDAGWVDLPANLCSQLAGTSEPRRARPGFCNQSERRSVDALGCGLMSLDLEKRLRIKRRDSTRCNPPVTTDQRTRHKAQSSNFVEVQVVLR